MKKAKSVFSIFCALLCASLSAAALGGCAAKPTASAPQAAPLPAQAAASRQSAPSKQSARMPLEDTGYRRAESETYRSLGAQVFLGEQAYPLAEAIYNYRDYHNMFLFDEAFNELSTADPALLVEIAVSQTPHVDLYSDAFDAFSENKVVSFWKSRQNSDQEISMITYGEDARAKAKELFGTSYELPGQQGLTFRYDPALDIYYLDSEGSSMSSDYPILTEVHQDGNEYTVKAILMSYWSYSGTWSNPDGSWESGEASPIGAVQSYLLEKQQSSPLPVVTFILREEGGALRVTGFQR